MDRGTHDRHSNLGIAAVCCRCGGMGSYQPDGMVGTATDIFCIVDIDGIFFVQIIGNYDFFQ